MKRSFFLLMLSSIGASTLADSNLVAGSELLRLMKSIPTPSGSAVFLVELHSPFQTPIIWLLHAEKSQITISTERFADANRKQPELKFTMRVQTDKPQTDLLITFAKKLRADMTNQVSSLDEVTCFIRAKGEAIEDYSIEKKFLEMPSESTERGFHKDAKEFVAWLIETTGVKPRNMTTTDSWSGGLQTMPSVPAK